MQGACLRGTDGRVRRVLQSWAFRERFLGFFFALSTFVNRRVVTKNQGWGVRAGFVLELVCELHSCEQGVTPCMLVGLEM